MAEAVFRSLTLSNPHIGTIDSAGTGAYHTLSPPDPRTTDTLHAHGIRDYDHGARKITVDDFREFDYVFAMDRSNLRDMLRLKGRCDGEKEKEGGRGGSKAKVMLFGEFGGKNRKGGGEEVGDPYYGADDGFEEVYEQVVRFSKGFLREVVDGMGGGEES